MSSSALPPLNNLPSWSRVSSLDRSRYPKPFLRDRLQALPPPGGKHGSSSDSGQAPLSMDIQLLDNLNAAEQQKLVYYDKSIRFLQQQHADTLKRLHEEIEQLKQENKELQFKFIMGQVGESNSDQHTMVFEKEITKSDQDADIQTMLLHEEVKDLKMALKNAQGRNMLLQHALHMQNRRKKSSAGKAPSSLSPTDGVFSPEQANILDTSPPTNSSLADDSSYLAATDQECPLPFGATLNPLRIRSSSQVEPRSPSIEECEVIIKYLHRLSARQTEENQLLKADLKTVLYPNKSRASGKYGVDSKNQNSNVKRKDEVSALERLERGKVRKADPHWASIELLDDLARRGLINRGRDKVLPWRPPANLLRKWGKHSYQFTNDEIKLPRVSFKDNLPDQKAQSGASPDRVSLPALKQTINTNVADRKKRQQAVQKARGRKDAAFQHLV